MSAHLPAPWTLCYDGQIDAANGKTVCTFKWDCFKEFNEGDNAPTARLIAAAPELLAEIELEYTTLADFHNQWEGRHTTEGQAKLCRLRDLICKATGRGAQDVQDDYGMRNAIAAKATGNAA